MTNFNQRYESGSRILLLCFLLLLSTPLTLAQTQPNTTTTNQIDPYYKRFSPSLAIIIVILVAALFLMGFFSIYVRHCADSPSNTVRNNATGGRSRRGMTRGLDPSVIETFPTIEYSAVKIHKIGKGALECAVCLCEFEDTETLRLIPKCDHVFHPECVDEWLTSHTTCPVCRANLAPQPGESVHGFPILIGEPRDIEAQNDVVETALEQQEEEKNEQPDVLLLNQTLNRNRTRGSRSSRKNRFPRSHSTGHSLIQPGENTERFTLRLPVEVREKILQNPELHRARSMVMLPREGSSRQGYRTGAGEGSSRGRFSRRLDRGFKSDRWVFTMAPPFLVRASSIRSPSPRVVNNAAVVNSAALPPLPPPPPQTVAVDSARLPV